MIKRSSKQYTDSLIEQNPNWKILDIGCGYTAHEKANVICDIQDLSSFYKNKKLPLRTGMSLSANIILRQRPVLSLFTGRLLPFWSGLEQL